MGIFRKRVQEQEFKNNEQIIRELLDTSERYFTRTLGQWLRAAYPTMSDMDPEMLEMVNDALDYWGANKELCIQVARRQDAQDLLMRSQLEKLQKEQEKTNKLLEELSRKKDK